jgi:AcrR family transcriptional regulator
VANEEIRERNIETALKKTVHLFIEHGIQNTTREMIARESNLSRKSLERYFPDKTSIVVEAAEWFGKYLHGSFEASGYDIKNDRRLNAAQLLELYLKELKWLAMTEPRVFACYAEFKAYLYRNSEDRERDYCKFMEAVGCRRLLQRIFERGMEDGSLTIRISAEAAARYLTNTVMAYFSNVVLLYDTDRKKMESYLDQYIEDTLRTHESEK